MDDPNSPSGVVDLGSSQPRSFEPVSSGPVPPETPVPPPPPPETPVLTPALEAQTGVAPEFTETFVVPQGEPTTVPTEAPAPVAPPPPSPAVNPFIPQGITPTNNPAVAQSGKPKSRPKPFIIFLIIGIIVIGLAILVKIILGGMSANKQVTLTYWGLWEDEAVVKPVLDQFTSANPNIIVNYVKESPQQYRERLQAAIARGDGPDVFRFHNTWVPMLRNELLPAPPKIVSGPDVTGAYYPVVAADLVAGSTVYGLPMMIDGLGLYYNVNLLNQAGITPPTTWPELVSDVPKLTGINAADRTITASAIALGTTNNVENFSDILATMFLQNGAKLTNPTGKQAEDTLIFYHKFSDPADPVYTWNDTLDNSISAFANSKVAMIIAPSWRAFDIKQLNPSLNFKIAPIPQLPGSNITWASYWVEGVSSKTKYPEQSWTLVKFLTSKTAVQQLYTEESKLRLFGEPYALTELGNTLTSDPYVGAYETQAKYAKSFPLASRTSDNGIDDRLIKYLEDAVNGFLKGSSPTDVLSTMSQGFRQVLGTFGIVVGAAPTSSP